MMSGGRWRRWCKLVALSHGMVDLVSYGDAHSDIDQALIALKNGAQLLKYGRKGKPKFYPFRLSNDESSLFWISSSGEKSLKLASVSRIIPGKELLFFDDIFVLKRTTCPSRSYIITEKDPSI